MSERLEPLPWIELTQRVSLFPGVSGSGKTYASMVLLRRLFDVAGGGPETDAFKHLAAAFTVLRALGTAATPANSSSSRIVSSPSCSYSRCPFVSARCYW